MMKIRYLYAALPFVFAIFISSMAHGQAQNSAGSSKTDLNSSPWVDPQEMSGPWLGEERNAKHNNFAAEDQKLPEPPLTDWAKQHLLYKAISHNPRSGTLMPGSDAPGFKCPNGPKPCYSMDEYGVIANDPNGEYPGKDCEPLSTPAIYDYPRNGSMELSFNAQGDRVYQFFEYHREWRTFWLKDQHPKRIDPTYEGDSIAHWDGKDLIVDTIGYNQKTMITQSVGHAKSDAFHLVERFHLVDHDHLIVDMDYYDTKAWGDKSWPGFRKYYYRVAKDDFMEFICSPRGYAEYDSKITDPLKKSTDSK